MTHSPFSHSMVAAGLAVAVAAVCGRVSLVAAFCPARAHSFPLLSVVVFACASNFRHKRELAAMGLAILYDEP